jgi:hypothetical protein
MEERATARIKRATKPQISYLEQLLIDCGFDTLTQRNAYLSRELSRDIVHLEDVYASECSRLIDELKERKGRIKNQLEQDMVNDEEDWW